MAINEITNIATINVRGLNNEQKRRIIFKWIQDNDIKIAFLQETFCTTEFSKFKDHGWKGEIKHNLSNSSHSRGVAIMLHEKLKYEIKNIHKKDDSRAILMNVNIEDVEVTLCNIYAPNETKNRMEFFKNLKFWISRHCENPEHLILGGDFNCALNENDRKTNANNTDKSRNELKNLLKLHKLIDSWYIKNTEPGFTYEDPVNMSKSRIDYFFNSRQIKYKIENIQLKHVPKKDRHKAVVMKINIKENNKGPGHWKMNSKILELPEFEKTLKEIVIDCKQNYPDLDRCTRWELLKIHVEESSKFIGKKFKRKKKKNQRNTKRN